MVIYLFSFSLPENWGTFGWRRSDADSILDVLALVGSPVSGGFFVFKGNSPNARGTNGIGFDVD